MNARRDYRGVRSSLFEGLEEGVNRASSSYSAHSSLEISDQDNDRSLDGLKDKVGILKKLTTDIHEEVNSQNRFLDSMGNQMDTSRGLLSTTTERFKKVFEAKSGKSLLMMIAIFVGVFLLVYFLVR